MTDIRYGQCQAGPRLNLTTHTEMMRDHADMQTMVTMRLDQRMAILGITIPRITKCGEIGEIVILR